MTSKSDPKPIPPFLSVQEAVDSLVNYNKAETIAKPKELMGDVKSIVDASIRGNIFRAFRRLDNKPSVIYRDWAQLNYKPFHEALHAANDQGTYNEALMLFTNRFIDYWAKECKDTRKRIGFGPAAKMVNLLVKTIQQHEKDRIEGLETFMHVPFDWFTLSPLKFIINDLTEVQYGIPIPKNATMQFVTSTELYFILQNAIRKLAHQANCAPIMYDYMCWDGQH